MNCYDINIGIEIHTELNTKTKVFCGCGKSANALPNSKLCPVCLALPGSIPLLNQKAVELTIKAGFCTNCEINQSVIFERKQYFYPDLTKSYQLSQVKTPFCVNGHLTLSSGKKIRISDIHLEEDTGKINHNIADGKSLIDYNRCGLSLIELVTHPDFSRGEEVVEFMEILRWQYIYAGVSNCAMEEGEMRCDINLSVRKAGEKELGKRVEMKNIGSFKEIIKAVNFESQRQIFLLESGKKVAGETRKWDEKISESVAMREKKGAVSYRVFAEPDLFNICISDESLTKIKNSMPVLPAQHREILKDKYNLTPYEINLFIKNKAGLELFMRCVSLYNNAKSISNWILNDYLALKNLQNGEIKISDEDFVYIIQLTDGKKITKTAGAALLKDVVLQNKSPQEIISQTGMLNDLSEGEYGAFINQALSENQKALEDYKKNPDKVINFLIGQVMRLSKGKCKSDTVKEMLVEVIGKR